MGEFDMDGWWEDRSLKQKFGWGALFATLAVAFVFALGLVVMLLWNWLMPDIFGLPAVSYWQAWGLLILASILFKDIGGGSSNKGERSTDKRRKRELRRYVREQADSAEADNTEADSAEVDRTEAGDDREEL